MINRRIIFSVEKKISKFLNKNRGAVMRHFLEDPNTRFIDKVYVKAYRGLKSLGKYLVPRTSDQTVVFIVGCQRSGTTLLQRIFETDFDTKVYGEISPLSSRDQIEKIRLNPLDEVKNIIEQNRSPISVIKPLVETQNTHTLLDFFPGSKALFIYRNYRDVISSNLNRFGLQNGIRNLRPIFEGSEGNWRSENVPDDIRQIVAKFFSEDMNPYDAAGLFWYARNRFFFDLKLNEDSRVLLIKYEYLVNHPDRVQNLIYEHIGGNYRTDNDLKMINSESVGKGLDVELSPEVEELCAGLMKMLDGHWMNCEPA